MNGYAFEDWDTPPRRRPAAALAEAPASIPAPIPAPFSDPLRAAAEADGGLADSLAARLFDQGAAMQIMCGMLSAARARLAAGGFDGEASQELAYKLLLVTTPGVCVRGDDDD